MLQFIPRYYLRFGFVIIQGEFPAVGGATLELVAADISQRKTLLPEYFQGVRGLIICSAAVVGPSDDTEDRKKYYQVCSLTSL